MKWPFEHRLHICSGYERLLADHQLTDFDALWHISQGKLVKRIAARSVTRLCLTSDSAAKTLYLKRHFQENPGIRGWLRRILKKQGVSQGWLELENLRLFKAKGLPTITPVAAGERITGLLQAESFLVTEDFAPYVALEDMLQEQPTFFQGSEGKARKAILLQKIAALAKTMHSRGLNHRDFNSTHILVHYPEDTNTPELALFDLQRIEKHPLLRLRWKIKSLARLNYSLPRDVFTPQDRLQLFLYYQQRNHLCWRDFWQWHWLEKKTARIKKHTEKSNKKQNKYLNK